MIKRLALLSLLWVMSTQVLAQILLDSTYVNVSIIAQDIYFPWEIIWGPDNMIWFTQPGLVKRINPKTGQLTTLLIVADHTTKGSKQMGLAVDPSFSSNKFVYIDYNYTGATYNPPLNHNVYLKIVRYTYNPSTDQLENSLILMDGIRLFDGYHDGGKLVIADNHIFITVGDAKQPENPELHPYLTASDISLPQNLNVFNGKVLRFNLDGSVPPDNPFAKLPYDKTPRNLIWSYGHRNTQGLVVGNGGKLYYAEHGRDNDDEMGIIKKGMNYGWPLIEGFCDKPFELVSCDTILNDQEPLKAWNPNVAPSDMEYIADSPIGEFQNSILVGTLTGDNFGNHISVLGLSAAGDAVIHERKLFFQQYGRIRDLCLDPQGNVYFSTSNTTAGIGRVGDDKIMKISFASKAVVTALVNKIELQPALFPNPLTEGRQLNIQLQNSNGELQLWNMIGVLIKSYPVTQKEFAIDLGFMPSGIYFMQYVNSSKLFTSKIVIP